MSIRSTYPIQRLLSAACLLTLLALNQLFVYGQAPARTQTLRVTAAVTAEQVRYLAPLDVTQMHLEVFDWSGNRLYDSGVRLGSLLDWSWQDETGNRLADGLYRCVLTFKDLSGQTSQRVGTLSRQGTEAALQVDERNPLSLSESSLATAGAAPTVWLGHDGRDARLSSGRGDLSFRSGDFFAGKDVEQMRLTADGNLGLGIARPQARLDVAGLIRTSEGIVFPDGTVQTTAAASSSRGIAPSRAIDSLSVGAKLAPTSPAETNETTQGDGSFANINMAATDLGGGLRISDIRLTNNNAGLRFTATPALGASPDGAAIQFWGNSSAFGGNLFLDGGARDGASLIFRTAGTGQTITERMRVTSNGNVGIGLNNPGSPLTVAGVIQSTVGGFRFPDGTLQTTAATGGGGGGGGGTITGVTAGTGLSGGGTTGNVTLSLNQTFTDARYVLKAGDTVAGDLALNNKMLKLRGASDINHGMLWNAALDGAEFRGFLGFRWTTGPGGETEQMRLTNEGRLGLGTTTPGSLLTLKASTSSATALEINQGAIKVAGAGINTNTAAFVHRATAGSILQGFTTLIDHPMTNGDPNAILIVTWNRNPGGGAQLINPHPIGVFYDGAKWRITFENNSPIPVGAAFNVLVIKP